MAEEIKRYSAREEKLNVLTHLCGIVLTAAGIPPLIALALKHDHRHLLAAMIFYAAALLVMFTVSTLYHRMNAESKRKLFRKFDHCAIYLFITGTYAPLVFGVVKNAAGYWIFGSLLALTLLGTAGKLRFGHRFHRIEIAIYLLMGWCCVILAGTLIRRMSSYSLIFLLAGGIAYSGGIAAYASSREFSHAAWHVFVLLGAGLQYFAILTMFD